MRMVNTTLVLTLIVSVGMGMSTGWAADAPAPTSANTSTAKPTPPAQTPAPAKKAAASNAKDAVPQAVEPKKDAPKQAPETVPDKATPATPAGDKDKKPAQAADKSGSPDKPAADAKPKVDEQAKAAAQAKFQEVFEQWKALLSKLVGLQIKYRTANDERRQEIQQEWKDVSAEGKKLAAQLIAAAEKAYAIAPNEDPQLTEFMVNLLTVKVRDDEFETAARIGKLLMENGCDDPHAAVVAGAAALVVNDYDDAEKYLKQAAEKKTPFELDPAHQGMCMLLKVFLRNPEVFKEAWAKEQQIRKNEAIADNLPRVLLKTSKGDIELELFENDAPLTVNNFVYLVDRGFYDGLTFHRVLPGFMAQAGDPKGDGSGGPGYRIPCECYKSNIRHHFRGSLSMAKAGAGGSDGQGRDTGGSQFFLTFVPTANLDGHHTVFGRVVKGMDVLAKLQRRNPDDQDPPRPDKILEAKVLRKRSHDYIPKRVETE